MPSTATASKPANRANAMLDAAPACRGSTASITVVVNCATVAVMWRPSTTMPGSTLAKNGQPRLTDRPSSASPAAATAGRNTSGSLAPMRRASPPEARDSSPIDPA